MSGEDFSGEPGRISDLYVAIQDGDAAAAIDAVGQATSQDFSHNQISTIILIGVLLAFAALIRRLQPLLQPIFDALGQGLHERLTKPKP